MCLYTPKGVGGQGFDDWLHSAAAVCVAKNSRPVCNEQIYCMLIQVKKRKMCIVIEALWYSSAANKQGGIMYSSGLATRPAVPLSVLLLFVC